MYIISALTKAWDTFQKKNTTAKCFWRGYISITKPYKVVILKKPNNLRLKLNVLTVKINQVIQVAGT